ncbi:manganese efflux pump [Bacillus haikouensis]|jgi:manganese efflux pump family protein|uniref:manganese efflux pump MntP n=1 Tax=Bacillus haikouensis TaxID=1510468 RepID=UPI001554D451|nr:manganese efflux pump MntP family protein [Bacillus haikouensis]NQD68138.1 manganese efflux pump [Bacillus haikouensis]
MTTLIGELITLMLMAFALGMDAFSIGIGMGMFQLRLKQIFYIGLTVGLFHVWMPLLGMITGKFLSDTFGSFATYAGGILLVVLGIQMFMSSFKDEETSLITPAGFGLLLFALSVSLDSFSVGLTLGIFGARTAVALACFGVAATLLTWIGLLLGKKFQGVLGTYSEALGGSILFAFGIKLLLPL